MVIEHEQRIGDRTAFGRRHLDSHPATAVIANAVLCWVLNSGPSAPNVVAQVSVEALIAAGILKPISRTGAK